MPILTKKPRRFLFFRGFFDSDFYYFKIEYSYHQSAISESSKNNVRPFPSIVIIKIFFTEIPSLFAFVKITFEPSGEKRGSRSFVPVSGNNLIITGEVCSWKTVILSIAVEFHHVCIKCSPTLSFVSPCHWHALRLQRTEWIVSW